MKQARFPPTGHPPRFRRYVVPEYYKEGTVFELYNFIYKNIPSVDVLNNT